MDKGQDKKTWGGHSEDIVELLKDYKYSIEYPPDLPNAYIYFNYWMMTDPRDKLHELGLDNDPRVIEIDKKLLEGLKKYIPPDYSEKERKDKPLERWWWHLDKIADKTYPAELLPEHLREIYLSSF
ncbi:MAG: hypothetical protein NZ526_00385 [Aquificaceae bacterium]|nr:hypothetical protein [Aquificaceae bacterium]MCS7306989.1 hypothetical protein [Aquificaceae bacterium]